MENELNKDVNENSEDFETKENISQNENVDETNTTNQNNQNVDSNNETKQKWNPKLIIGISIVYLIDLFLLFKSLFIPMLFLLYPIGNFLNTSFGFANDISNSTLDDLRNKFTFLQ